MERDRQEQNLVNKNLCRSPAYLSRAVPPRSSGRPERGPKGLRMATIVTKKVCELDQSLVLGLS